MGWNSDSSKVSIGRGRVLLSRFSDAGVKGPLFGVGNSPGFEFATMGDDRLEITDYQQRSATPLTIISRKRAPEFTLKLTEPSVENLALLFAAEEPTEYTQTNTPISGESLGTVRVGGIYRTAKMSPTITAIESGATAFTLGTHYEVLDALVGLIRVIALPAGVVAGDPLTADYTPATVTAGSGYQRVLGATKSKIEGSLLFIGNSDIGPVGLFELYKCSIESDGAMPFISTDAVEFSLKLTGLSDGVHSNLWEYRELSAS